MAPIYEVNGNSQKTGRPIKAKTIEAVSEAKARSEAEVAGMVVIEVKLLQELEPTEKQLTYAKDLGIKIPEGVNRRELSDLISNSVDWDEIASDAIRGVAEKLEIPMTKYTGEKELYNRIWRAFSLAPAKTRAAWFAYCLYRDLLPKRMTPVATTHDHPAILAIAEKAAEDQGIMESIDRYRGESVAFFGQRTSASGQLEEGGSQRTKAYKFLCELLRADPVLGIPERTENKPTTIGKSSPKKAAAQTGGSGCLIMAALLITAGICVTLLAAWIFTGLG